MPAAHVAVLHTLLDTIEDRLRELQRSPEEVASDTVLACIMGGAVAFLREFPAHESSRPLFLALANEVFSGVLAGHQEAKRVVV